MHTPHVIFKRVHMELYNTERMCFKRHRSFEGHLQSRISRRRIKFIVCLIFVKIHMCPQNVFHWELKIINDWWLCLSPLFQVSQPYDSENKI